MSNNKVKQVSSGSMDGMKVASGGAKEKQNISTSSKQESAAAPKGPVKTKEKTDESKTDETVAKKKEKKCSAKDDKTKVLGESEESEETPEDTDEYDSDFDIQDILDTNRARFVEWGLGN